MSNEQLLLWAIAVAILLVGSIAQYRKRAREVHRHRQEQEARERKDRHDEMMDNVRRRSERKALGLPPDED